MSFTKRYFAQLMAVGVFILYLLLARLGLQLGGSVVAAVLSNLGLIAGVGAVYWVEQFKYGRSSIISTEELRQNGRSVTVSYMLIAILWVFGQFVFRWIYHTFGDATYTSNYADTFGDSSVLLWTLLLVGIVAPIAEELVFRYVLFGRLIFKNGERPSWLRYVVLHVLSAGLFGLVHGTMVHQVVVLPLAFVLATLMYKTNRIVFPILGHMLFNNLSVFLSPLMVIGADQLENPLIVGTMLLLYGFSVVSTLYFVWTQK